MLQLQPSSIRVRESNRSALENDAQRELQQSRATIPCNHAKGRVNLVARRGIEIGRVINGGPLRVVERVVRFSPQLDVNTIFDVKTLRSSLCPNC